MCNLSIQLLPNVVIRSFAALDRQQIFTSAVGIGSAARICSYTYMFIPSRINKAEINHHRDVLRQTREQLLS